MRHHGVLSNVGNTSEWIIMANSTIKQTYAGDNPHDDK